MWRYMQLSIAAGAAEHTQILKVEVSFGISLVDEICGVFG